MLCGRRRSCLVVLRGKDSCCGSDNGGMAFALFGYLLAAVGFYAVLIRTAEVKEERVVLRVVEGGRRSDTEEYRRAA